ncbi:hypothetical protein K9L16_01670 [Candidatus Pacearchaeota archaeon]|nr:hypothetical protein [Candidatus Pacearchaeota archaeon]
MENKLEFDEKINGFVTPQELREKFDLCEKDFENLCEVYNQIAFFPPGCKNRRTSTRKEPTIKTSYKIFKRLREENPRTFQLWGEIRPYLAKKFSDFIGDKDLNSRPSFEEFFGRALACKDEEYRFLWHNGYRENPILGGR